MARAAAVIGTIFFGLLMAVGFFCLYFGSEEERSSGKFGIAAGAMFYAFIIALEAFV